jgi:hypothetical protein
MVTLGLLQNQWFPADRVAAKRILFARWSWPMRMRATRGYLELNGVTGGRLIDAFAERFDEIQWGNASPEITATPTAKVRPDIQHITALIEHVRPDVILMFGAVARDGIEKYLAENQLAPDAFKLISGPHPANRSRTTRFELRRMAHELELVLTNGVSGIAGAV